MSDQYVSPEYAVNDEHLIPISDYPYYMQRVPTSKMFIVRQALQKYRDAVGADAEVYDASQGDGGKSLPGVPKHLLEAAYQLQAEIGTGYDTPSGHPKFKKAVIENYWQLDASTGWGTDNVLAGQGGRDALMKAYSAMVSLGRGRVGDVLLTSAVPWISYNWGPYVAGLNVLRAPGDPNKAWSYTEEALDEAVAFARQSQRRVAGVIITSPDNPTGRTMPIEKQISLAKKALALGIGFVLFDWMYHWVTEGQSHDINQVLGAFTSAERDRLIFLDGLSKSLGASNVRSAHMLASTEVTKFATSHASHGVIPSFYSQAVAISAYEMGYGEAAKSIIEPTNASRKVLRKFLDEKDIEYIMGDGYYAFINVERWIKAKGLNDSIDLGQIIAEQYGLAVVPGAFFSPAAKYWVRFSYALPPERTTAASARLYEALSAML